jgi:uncharacterized protein (TIGR02117 family)
MIYNIFKQLLKVVTFIFSFIILWFLCAWLFPKIKYSSNLQTINNSSVTIFVKSNGVHTDIVMPKYTSGFNWTEFIDEQMFLDVDHSFNYVAIGWGDKGFYLETPTWDDLKLQTAFNAAFGLSNTALHVTFYKNITINQHIKKITLSKTSYLKLVNYIKQSFKLTNNHIILLKHPNYGLYDNYFEANGTYSLFKTCNVWTGNALKEADVPIGLWTPLAFGVMDNLEKN